MLDVSELTEPGEYEVDLIYYETLVGSFAGLAPSGTVTGYCLTSELRQDSGIATHHSTGRISATIFLEECISAASVVLPFLPATFL